jgi:PAS domain S-box-containing protein
MPATHSIRILHLEDSPRDAELIQGQLAAGGLACDFVLVDTKQGFEAALAGDVFDLILLDYNIAGYDGSAALQLTQRSRPDVPVIVVSGTIGEEAAVECLHVGATDYILKQRLARFVPAVRRALDDAEAQRRRRAAESALQESQAHLRRAQAVAHIGSWTVDIKHGLLVFSEESCRIFNMATGTALSYDAFLERVHPDDRKYMDRSWKAAIRHNRPFDVVHQILVDHEIRWVRERAELTFDATGVAVAAIGTIQDISERKTAERKLQARLEHLNLLQQITRAIGERQDLASIFQVVIRTLEDQLHIDFGCLCTYEATANRLTVTRVGLRSEALATELALTEQAHIDIDQNGLSRCIQGQLSYEPDILQVPFPFPQRLARGGLRALVATPLLVESKVFGVLIAARREAASFSSDECEFLRQLSEHVALAAHQAQLYAALQIAYDDLRQTQQVVMQQERLRALGQMASGIAHDINNAISPVALYTDSLLEKEPNLSTQGRSQLETIQTAIQDVAATVARMREFYRQREPQLTHTAVHLNPLVQQVVDLTRARWSDMPQQRGIVIHLHTELAHDPPAIMGIESEIRETLTNLIFNAVDAMAEGGTLTLRTQVLGGVSDLSRQVRIEVSDTGIGMDEEARRRCLEPFFTTKGERGTGLGLAMVYGMVQRHGAEIDIESALSQGTTVRLSFTAPRSATPAPTQSTTAHAMPPPLRILVVDDDPLLLKSLRETLEGDGHTILTANGGQNGIDLFRSAQNDKQTFDAVMTDLGMPHVDGRQVAAFVKAASPCTPVILLTGWGHRLMAEGDLPAHVDILLSKPPKLRELREALVRCHEFDRSPPE